MDIEGVPGLVASPLDTMSTGVDPEESTVEQMLQGLRNNASERVTSEVLNDVESTLSEEEYQIKGKAGRDLIKKKVKIVRETTPEMLEKDLFETIVDWGSKKFYEWLDPWSDTNQVSP